MSNENFWNDELVREFIQFGRRRHHISDQDIVVMDIEDFKKSKQVSNKEDYQIISFS